MKKSLSLIILTSFTLFVMGCAKNVSPSNYDASELGARSKVVHGVVVSKRLVKINTSTDKGGLAGAVAGGGVGASVGSSLASNMSPALGLSTFILSGVAGAVMGGVGGSALDHAINNQQAYEYIVKLHGGNMVSVVQDLEMQFAVNQPVLVVYGARTRLLADTVGYMQEKKKQGQKSTIHATA